MFNGQTKQFEDCDVEVGITPSLKEKPVRKKKKIPAELTDDDPIVNCLKRFEVEVYNVIMNSVLN